MRAGAGGGETVNEWDTIEAVKNAKHYDDKLEKETNEPATLKDKFEYLLDVLQVKEVQLDKVEAELAEFRKTWMNHRHRVFGVGYSGKAER